MATALTFSTYGGPEVLALTDHPTPEPGPGQLLIAVHAAGVNPVDWKIREGYMQKFMPLDLPAVMGREASGVVEAIGPDVSGFAIGDAVFGGTNTGGYAEYALLTASNTAHKPDRLSFIDAAALPVASATAYDAVVQLDLGPDDTVLIIGAGGGVGLAASQLARDRGAQVVGVASNAKADLLAVLGVTHVESGDGALERARIAAPHGVTAIVDLIGGDTLRGLAPLLTSPGRLLTAADPVTASELGGAPIARKQTAEVLDAVAAAAVSGALDPYVTETYTLARAADAIASVEAGHPTGKVVIAVL